jgi:hypothetical protein
MKCEKYEISFCVVENFQLIWKFCVGKKYIFQYFHFHKREKRGKVRQEMKHEFSFLQFLHFYCVDIFKLVKEATKRTLNAIKTWLIKIHHNVDVDVVTKGNNTIYKITYAFCLIFVGCSLSYDKRDFKSKLLFYVF